MSIQPAASHLFTVRLWPEPAAGGETKWRGQVTHVLSGETRYFMEASPPVRLANVP